MTVRLVILQPTVADGAKETLVEPNEAIVFKCVAEGKPTPTVAFTWLPFNETQSGQQPLPLATMPEGENSVATVEVSSETSTKQALLCQARNPSGVVEDRHVFNVLSRWSLLEFL